MNRDSTNEAPEQEIRYLGDVQRLALGPDDIVVVSCDKHITNETAERLRELCESQLPGHKVLVLSSGLRIGLLSPESA